MQYPSAILPFLIYSLAILSILTEATYSTVLPAISVEMGVEADLVQLSTTVYYAGFSVGILTLGRLSDIYGRRVITLWGIVCYALATCAISFSREIEIFILLRFVQAYGASIGSIIAQSIARDSFRGEALSQIYLNNSILMGAVPVVGTLIGGCILENYHTWQYVFAFLMLYALVVFYLQYRFLPETNVFIGTNLSHNFSFVLSAVSKDRVFISYAIIVGILNGNYFSFFIQAPFVFIDGLSISASLYGKLFALLSTATVMGSFLTKYLVKNYVSVNKIQTWGFILSLGGSLMLFLTSWLVGLKYSLHYSIISVFLPVSIQGIGYAMIVPTILAHCLDNYPKVLGSAGSILGGIYYIITAFTTFLVSMFYSEEMKIYSCIFGSLMIFAALLLIYAKSLERVEEERLL